MKISTEHVGRILQAQLTKIQRLGEGKEAAPAQKTDRATFSQRAEEMELAYRVIASQPAVRTEKVNELRAKIAAGEFEVSSEEVAEKIIAEARLSKLLGG